MARQRLAVGEFGEVCASRDGKKWRARVRFRDSSGVIRQLGSTGPTEKKAKLALRQKIAATSKHSRSTTLSDDPTVGDLCLHWLGTRRVSEGREPGTISPSTVEQYRYTITSAVIPGIGQLLVSEATVARIEMFLESMIIKVTESGKANQVKTVVSQAFDMAVRYGYIEANPVASVRPFPTPAPNPPRSWSSEEIIAVRQAVKAWAARSDGRRGPENTWLVDIVEFMLGTGCRISEALALTWDKVFLDDETAWVRLDQAVREPKRGKASLGPTKSGDIRDLELPAFLVKILRNRKEQAEATHLGSFVFASSKSTALRPSAVRRAFRAALDAAGINRSVDSHLRPHGARKTAATLIARTADIESAAAQLGHAGTLTAEKHYVEPEQRKIVSLGSVLQRLAPEVR